MNLKFVLKQYVKMGVQNILLPFIYKINSTKNVNKNLMIFADAHHHDIPYSMECMYEQVRGMGFETVCFFSDYQSDSFIVTLKNMFAFMIQYANAGYVVICDNFLPAASCKKREETKVIQLWHACGALKKFGYDTKEDIPGFYKGNVLKNCDYITVSSNYSIPFFKSAMKLPTERFVSTGISRTDNYFDDKYLDDVKKKFYRRYPEAVEKKVVLWAPTFRGNPAIPYVCGQEAIKKLQDQLGDDWFVISRLHPHIKEKGDLEECLIPTQELLPIIDILITDYSSVLYDYLIFKKPIVLFAPDLEKYEKERGFYTDYRKLPGRIVTDECELKKSVLEEYNSFDREDIEKAYNIYMNACDGQATMKIIKLLTKNQYKED